MNGSEENKGSFVSVKISGADTPLMMDVDDYEKFGHIQWRLGSRGYAVVNKYLGDGKWETTALHRLIMEAPDGMVVDHANRNKLDNRKINLRVATTSENAANSERSVGCSGYRGVYRSGKKYRARIRKDGSLINLGTFNSPEDAARMYNFWATDIYGEFARLNEIKVN